MNFSDYFQQSGALIKYQGDLVAVAKNFDVSIYETNTLKALNKY